MNKQDLEQRISAITNEMSLVKANYAKLEGHLNECQHWLETLNKSEKECATTTECAISETDHQEESCPS
jgi:prefoldin subunit 5